MALDAPPVYIGRRKSMEPWIKDSVDFLDHQVDGIRNLARRHNFLLADEMGLGKSLQALTVFGIAVIQDGYEKMLVVCPVTLKGNWADEIEEHTGFRYTILGTDTNIRTRAGRLKPLTKTQRTTQIAAYAAEKGPRILICNYEQIGPHLSELNAVGFDVRCFDEAHFLKNHKSKRTQAAIAMKARRTFLLTGTPMLNHVDELWTLFHMCDPINYRSYWKFVQRYCVFGGYEGKQIVGVKHNSELVERLGRIQLRRTADVLGATAPFINQVKIELTDFQRDVYEDWKALEVGDKLDLSSNPTPFELQVAATKTLKLRQIIGTTAAVDSHPDESGKLDRAIEIVQELVDSGEKVVVFTQFRGVLECWQRRARLHVDAPQWVVHGDIPKDERVPIVRAWGAVDGPSVCALMLQVGSMGLNMQAARHVVFLDKLYVPKLNAQAVGRVARIGQTRQVIVHDLIARNTVESQVERILKNKNALFDATVEQARIDQAVLDAIMARGGV